MATINDDLPVTESVTLEFVPLQQTSDDQPFNYRFIFPIVTEWRQATVPVVFPPDAYPNLKRRVETFAVQTWESDMASADLPSKNLWLRSIKKARALEKESTM